MRIQTPAGLSLARDHALQALTSAAKGDSLCTLRGEHVEAAKYFEGRVAALSALMRQDTTDDLVQRATELAAQWSTDYLERAATSAAWASYRQGLLDVCDEAVSSQ